MSSSKRLLFFSLIFGIVIVPLIAFSAMQFSFGLTTDFVKCDDGGIVPLSAWLTTNASVSIGYLVFFIPLFISGLLIENILLLSLSFCLSISFVLWTIAWSIVGGYTFFKFAYVPCKAAVYNGWLVVFISLVYQWVSLGIIIVFMSLLEREATKKNDTF